LRLNKNINKGIFIFILSLINDHLTDSAFRYMYSHAIFLLILDKQTPGSKVMSMNLASLRNNMYVVSFAFTYWRMQVVCGSCLMHRSNL